MLRTCTVKMKLHPFDFKGILSLRLLHSLSVASVATVLLQAISCACLSIHYTEWTSFKKLDPSFFFFFCFFLLCFFCFLFSFLFCLFSFHFFPFCPASIICGDFVLFTCLLLSYHIFPILSSSSVMSINFPHVLLGY